MKKNCIFILFIVLCLLCTSCNKTKNLNNNSTKEDIREEIEYSGINGTADTIEGKTVIISIYANDTVTNWNNDSDNTKINDTLNNLKIATDYLVKQVNSYNKEALFIYDWNKFDDIKYIANFNVDIVNNYKDNYDTQREWIVNNIDIGNIKKKYAADNLVFMYFFNTNDTNTSITSTYNRLDIDIIDVFPVNSNYTIPPATYAHELLHTFGAPDLYYANEIINQEYVDYLIEIDSNDIMAKVYYGDEITNEFSNLDAYYVGLIDESSDVTKWNLGLSEHVLK